MSADQTRMTELESALRTMQPSRLEISRDQLMYRAGQASMKRRSWIKGVSTTIIGLVAGVGGALLVLQTYPGKIREVVVVRIVQPAQSEPDVAKTPEDSNPKKLTIPDQKIEVTKKSSNPIGGEMMAIFGCSNNQPSMSNYLGLRNQVLRWGVDVMPAPANSASSGDSEPWSVWQMHGKKKDVPMEF